ncbi:transposase family protein [Brucella grignonensis]|uniref:Transposase family protein n=1 Tax=Brucella grignonensis TaxID=94627 RepID=A0A256FRG0_9HYPH|nr:transposase family protein [Brucella grignonensis]
MKQREFTEDFKREAVRILTTSGRSISSVAEDLGFGKSTLDRWRRNFAEKDLLSGPHEDMSQKLARLRKENKLLRQERDLLKKQLTVCVPDHCHSRDQRAVQPEYRRIEPARDRS